MKDENFQIAVLERGWVFVGYCEVADGVMRISAARNIRTWGAVNGLGELAVNGPGPGTKLDLFGVVNAPMASVVFTIATDRSLWKRS